MNNSQSKAAGARRVKPRNAPSQPCSTHTVEAILEGAAHILERHGLDACTTNAIAARAGVSIGSLYQYFPTKDAVTVALIERKRTGPVRDALLALEPDDRCMALRQLIEVAVRHQLRRPALAMPLDFEQHRLSAVMPVPGNGAAMHAALTGFMRGGYSGAMLAPEPGASDLMAIIISLTDAAGRRGNAEPAPLAARIEAAVLGYLGAPDFNQAATTPPICNKE